MITTAWAQTMAAYKRWQNETVITAVDQLDDAARSSDQGLFFGSITSTLKPPALGRPALAAPLRRQCPTGGREHCPIDGPP